MLQPLTALDAAGWRRFAHLADVAALIGGVGLGLAWAGLDRSHLGFATLYVGFVIAITRGPQKLAERLLPSGFDSVLDALKACSVSVLLALGTSALLNLGAPGSLATQLWFASLVSIGLTRVAVSLIGQRARRHGSLMTPTLVVGAGFVGARVVRRLIETPEYGLRPVGFLDADPLPGALQPDEDAPILGAPEDLAKVIEQTGAKHVILSFASERDHRLIELVNQCREQHIDVSVVPRLYESMNERVTLEHVGGLPLLSLRAVDPKGWQFAIKHTFDRVGAVLALLTVGPLMIAIAIAVKLTSPGPVIFRQRRVGRDGRVFDVLKFRTMTDAPGSRFDLGSGLAPGGVEGADRRTRLGKWLRASSLDELPQLLNVLRGEMSLVGPRPERPEFVEQFAKEVYGYRHRHRVKSGITGWAQVNGLRGQTSIADRAEWDNHYIENWSLALELRTIALTLAEVLRFREQRSSAGSEKSRHQPPDRALELVADGAEAAAPVWFCGYCGDAPPQAVAPAPVARVCGECGQGLMLETRGDGAPRPGEAFVVVDTRQTVQALSQQAEEFLKVSEEIATDRPLGELLVGADSEEDLQQSIISILETPSPEEDALGSAFVRPRATFGVRMRARISACGPPRAVLIVLEDASSADTPTRHLRVVPDARQTAQSA